MNKPNTDSLSWESCRFSDTWNLLWNQTRIRSGNRLMRTNEKSQMTDRSTNSIFLDLYFFSRSLSNSRSSIHFSSCCWLSLFFLPFLVSLSDFQTHTYTISLCLSRSRSLSFGSLFWFLWLFEKKTNDLPSGYVVWAQWSISTKAPIRLWRLLISRRATVQLNRFLTTKITRLLFLIKLEFNENWDFL